MKALSLILAGAIVIAVSLANIGALGAVAFLLMIAGGALGLWGLVANHRDHTRR